MTYGGLGDIYVDVLRWRPGDGYKDAEIITSFFPDKLSVVHGARKTAQATTAQATTAQVGHLPR